MCQWLHVKVGQDGNTFCKGRLAVLVMGMVLIVIMMTVHWKMGRGRRRRDIKIEVKIQLHRESLNDYVNENSEH